MASLTDAEIQEIKYHLGYGALGIGSLPYIQGTLIFEQVVQQNLNDFGVNRIRNTVLPNIRQLETDLYEGRDRYGVKELVGDLVFDTEAGRTAYDRLLAQKEYWIDDLEKLTRVPRARPASAGATVTVS